MSEKNKETRWCSLTKNSKRSQTPLLQSRSPQRKRASFIDDAGSILSDIKSAIGDDVAEELQRFEDERRSAAAAVLQREEALQEARRAEIQARRAAEEARRQAAAEEREMLLNRLNEKQQPEVVSTPITHATNRVEHSQPQFSAPEPPKKNKTPIFAVAIAIAVVGAGYVATTSTAENGQVSTLQPNTSSTPAKSSSAAGTPPSATKGAVKSEPNTKQNATKAAAMPVTGQDAGITATGTADAQKNGDEAKTAPADSSKAAAKPKRTKA